MKFPNPFKLISKGVRVPKDVAQKITFLTSIAAQDKATARVMLEKAFSDVYKEMDRTEFLAFMTLGTLALSIPSFRGFSLFRINSFSALGELKNSFNPQF